MTPISGVLDADDQRGERRYAEEDAPAVAGGIGLREKKREKRRPEAAGNERVLEGALAPQLSFPHFSELGDSSEYREDVVACHLLNKEGDQVNDAEHRHGEEKPVK
jgi:hypothetical protein